MKSSFIHLVNVLWKRLSSSTPFLQHCGMKCSDAAFLLKSDKWYHVTDCKNRLAVRIRLKEKRVQCAKRLQVFGCDYFFEPVFRFFFGGQYFKQLTSTSSRGRF